MGIVPALLVSLLKSPLQAFDWLRERANRLGREIYVPEERGRYSRPMVRVKVWARRMGGWGGFYKCTSVQAAGSGLLFPIFNCPTIISVCSLSPTCKSALESPDAVVQENRCLLYLGSNLRPLEREATTNWSMHIATPIVLGGGGAETNLALRRHKM